MDVDAITRACVCVQEAASLRELAAWKEARTAVGRFHFRKRATKERALDATTADTGARYTIVWQAFENYLNFR